MKQKDLETQLKQIPVLSQQLSDHHEALNAMRKEFSAPLSDIPAQAKHRDGHIQGLNKKLGQLQKIIIQLSVNDRQQPHFNETLNAKTDDSRAKTARECGIFNREASLF